MKYKNIKDFNQRCEEHPDHQTGMISERMIQQRLSEEIDELRDYIEQRTWVGLTEEDLKLLSAEWRIVYGAWMDDFARDIEAKLKEKNNA